jgi:hypothetical protein
MNANFVGLINSLQEVLDLRDVTACNCDERFGIYGEGALEVGCVPHLLTRPVRNTCHSDKSSRTRL